MIAKIAPFILILIPVALAGTVTLNSVCTKGLNSKYVLMNITNSGDSDAYSSHISFLLITENKTYYYFDNVTFINSSSSVSLSFPANQSIIGTYPAFGVDVYQILGTSSLFSAVFPCSLSFRNSTSSQIILSLSRKQSFGNEKIIANLTDIGYQPINATVLFVIPPLEFNYSNLTLFKEVSLTPFKSAQVYVELKPKPNVGAFNVTLPVFAFYALKGTGHTTYSYIVVSNQAANSQSGIVYLVISISVGIVLILLGLIIKTMFKRKIKKAKAKGNK
ncbi:MAG: hypothetical protein QXL16_01520 [Candidatus Micrarchaeaceae archaeon]